MGTITTKDGTQLYFNDWGTGTPDRSALCGAADSLLYGLLSMGGV